MIAWWNQIEPIADESLGSVNVIIEIPKGSQNKYEIDKKRNVIRLDRVLFSPLHYPGDYGIIPQTLAEDGDPLDALILVTFPNYPGILVEARPIGLLRMRDNGQPDDKVLCVPKRDPRYESVQDINNLEKHILKEIAHFFDAYKELEEKEVKIEGWGGAEEAKDLVKRAVEAYRKVKHEQS